MKSILKISFLFVILYSPILSFSQVKDSLPKFIKSAKFDGVIKTKLETSTEAGVMRFNVRNSRLGVRGDVSEYLSYRVQVELSNEGQFSPLDLCGILKPTKNLTLMFGQTSVPFENNYIITPAEMMFANRAFVGKYFTPGSRDIGVVAQYKFTVADVPLEAQAGMFNGGKINNPQWTDEPSYAFRLTAGSMTGFKTSAKIYQYNNDKDNRFHWGADVHYARKRLRLEAEVMSRHSELNDSTLLGTYVQGAYTFDLRSAKLFRNLTPAVRWDAMGYDNKLDVNRISAGLDFGLTFLPWDSVLRVNYEHYFCHKNPVDFPDFDNRDAHVADNKITVELVVKF